MKQDKPTNKKTISILGSSPSPDIKSLDHSYVELKVLAALSGEGKSLMDPNRTVDNKEDIRYNRARRTINKLIQGDD